MIYPLSRFGLLTLAQVAGFGLATAALPPRATAQTPSAADQDTASRMVEDSSKGRHLAPHDTFYLLKYVSVKTDKGVEGFDPGQEVHLVEVRRDSHSLVVSNGRAQVAVSPSMLTNDMDMAALVRQRDEASQARIAQHIKDEQAAYAKFEREAADATAKDLAERRDEQRREAEEARREEQAPVAQIATPTPYPASGGYYGDGGFGYGSPYSYFSGPSAVVNLPANNGQTAAPNTGGGAAGGSKVAAPNPATIGTAGRPPR